MGYKAEHLYDPITFGYNRQHGISSSKSSKLPVLLFVAFGHFVKQIFGSQSLEKALKRQIGGNENLCHLVCGVGQGEGGGQSSLEDIGLLIKRCPVSKSR